MTSRAVVSRGARRVGLSGRQGSPGWLESAPGYPGKGGAAEKLYSQSVNYAGFMFIACAFGFSATWVASPTMEACVRKQADAISRRHKQMPRRQPSKNNSNISGAFMASIASDLRQIINRLDDRAVIDNDITRLTRKACRRLSCSEPEIAGHPLSKFTSVPYVEVGRGRIRDGLNGRILSHSWLKGVHAPILAHLIEHNKIHAMLVAAMQAKSAEGTVKLLHQRAGVTMSKLGSCLNGCGLSVSRTSGNDTIPEWQFSKDHGCKVQLSVIEAVRQAEQAEHLLLARDARCALSTALAAIKTDPAVLRAHTAFVRSASELGMTAIDADCRQQLPKSYTWLEARHTGLRRVSVVIEATSIVVKDKDGWGDLDAINEELADQAREIQTVLDSAEPLLQSLRPEDLDINRRIQQLRRMRKEDGNAKA